MIFNSESIKKLYRTISKQVNVKENSDFFPETVVGCDVSYKKKAKVSCVVFNVKKRQVIEEITFEREVCYEYIPAKFTIRELPLIGEAISRISAPFDCIIVDGHGIAHPDKAGLACFTGFFLTFRLLAVLKIF